MSVIDIKNFTWRVSQETSIVKDSFYTKNI